MNINMDFYNKNANAIDADDNEPYDGIEIVNDIKQDITLDPPSFVSNSIDDDEFKHDCMIMLFSAGSIETLEKRGWGYMLGMYYYLTSITEYELFSPEFFLRDDVGDWFNSEKETFISHEIMLDCVLCMAVDSAIDIDYECKPYCYSELTHLAGILMGKRANKSLVKTAKRTLKGAKKGGRLHHSEDRHAFKNDYCAERTAQPNNTRASVVKLLTPHYKHLASTTLSSWAKEADVQDGIIRAAGRPKKNG